MYIHTAPSIDVAAGPGRTGDRTFSLRQETQAVILREISGIFLSPNDSRRAIDADMEAIVAGRDRRALRSLGVAIRWLMSKGHFEDVVWHWLAGSGVNSRLIINGPGGARQRCGELGLLAVPPEGE